MTDAALTRFLARQQLSALPAKAQWAPLAGGVSSDIWRVDLAEGRSICVKRACAELKVAAHWEAPVSRNSYEWEWLCFAHGHMPNAVPQPLAHDAQAGMLAMAFLNPVDYPVWKAQLLAGNIDVDFSACVGRLLAFIHAKSAAEPDIAARFDTLANFHALRLEPYLIATAARHPDIADHLTALATHTAQTTRALVHGDVSPKNILAGPKGPVFLDAECAWFGDPAFDLAFCLNHLLLKSVLMPEQAPRLASAYDTIAQSYLNGVTWERPQMVEERAAMLLPALMLARIDGKSPVEYLVDERQKMLVRKVARHFLLQPASHLIAIRDYLSANATAQ